MAELPSGNRAPIARLILIPSVITLVVTLLRLIGELRHWSPALFNPSPGGGGALVGITWLVPIFGIYFGLKLSAAGEGPAGVGKASGLSRIGENPDRKSSRPLTLCTSFSGSTLIVR